jgi:hypothetical protein
MQFLLLFLILISSGVLNLFMVPTDVEVCVNIHLYNYVLIITFLSVRKSLILEKPLAFYINFVHNME